MNTKREFWKRNAMAVIGMLIFSAGINLFIVPANLYNGGVLGISQVLRWRMYLSVRNFSFAHWSA